MRGCSQATRPLDASAVKASQVKHARELIEGHRLLIDWPERTDHERITAEFTGLMLFVPSMVSCELVPSLACVCAPSDLDAHPPPPTHTSTDRRHFI